MFKINKYYPLLFLAIVLNSEILFLTGWKRTGIPFFREFFLITITAISLIYIGTKILKKIKFKKIELILFAFVLLGIFSPAIHANIMYGQPLMYGLLEERRILSYLSFFVIMTLARKTQYSSKDLTSLVITSGYFILIVSTIYALGIIPENKNISFMIEDGNYGMNDPRYATRFPINTNYIFLAYCLSLTSILFGKSIKLSHIGFAILAILYVLLIDQGRTNIAMFAFCTTLLLAKASFHNTVKAFLYISCIIIATPFILMLMGASDYFDTFNFLISNASTPIEQHVRYQTTHTIFKLLSESCFFGWGSLSLQWNGGFHRLYGPNFYLSDVALFGTLLRHGWLSIVVIALYFKILITCTKSRSYNAEISQALQATALSFLVFGFLNGKLEYAGSTIAVMLAIASLPSRPNAQIRHDQ